MTAAGVLVYGNYFEMQTNGRYDIAVTVRRAGSPNDVALRFRDQELKGH